MYDMSAVLFVKGHNTATQELATLRCFSLLDHHRQVSPRSLPIRIYPTHISQLFRILRLAGPKYLVATARYASAGQPPTIGNSLTCHPHHQHLTDTECMWFMHPLCLHTEWVRLTHPGLHRSRLHVVAVCQTAHTLLKGIAQTDTQVGKCCARVGRNAWVPKSNSCIDHTAHRAAQQPSKHGEKTHMQPHACGAACNRQAMAQMKTGPINTGPSSTIVRPVAA
jgi:hypothetical protein